MSPWRETSGNNTDFSAILIAEGVIAFLAGVVVGAVIAVMVGVW